jgi:2-C-methyl-D-erythritol 4-phosphate cytidylyltransferase/2-C-methyl-D-erythritol 2,4-cyclodiphosphate synthase
VGVSSKAGEADRRSVSVASPRFHAPLLMTVSAIIAAGGYGHRLGAGRPKQLLDIGGRPILERSVSTFLAHTAITELVVALPAELAATPPAYLSSRPKPVQIVAGGPRRQDSVRNAFLATHEASHVIVVHDAARPFVSADLITRTIDAALESGAAIAALASRDTVKRATTIGASAVVAETLPRESIVLAQTPQAFRREVLLAALALGESEDATDEATLAERAGCAVRIVDGERTNMKVTTPEDLPLAETIARGTSGATSIRIGTGYDLHRLVEGRPLVLGGVTIPFERGLLGHSDADAVCHAAIDAVLGAAATGNIGSHFPDTDAEWRGASSLDLLGRAAEIVRAQGYRVANLDVVVIAERPKLGPFVEAMRARVAEALGVMVSAVSIKGKSNEGIGDIGRGEAIAAHAVALVERQ